MHNNLSIYYFIDKFDLEELLSIKLPINIIYRNYEENIQIKNIIKIRDFCKKRKIKFFLANNIKLAIKLNLDGVYLPAFNKNLNIHNYTKKKNFLIIGSAHSVKEVKIKEMQNCERIFLSPIFKTKKSKFFLGIVKFNLLASFTKRDVVCLGGIKETNLKGIRMTKSKGLASIS